MPVSSELQRDISLDELLSEPIVKTLMRRDRVTTEDVRGAFDRRRGTAHDSVLQGTNTGMPTEFRHPLCRFSVLCDGILPILGSAISILVLVLLPAALR